MKEMKLWVGTTKGLVEFHVSNGICKYQGIHFEGLNISTLHIHLDGSVYVSISHKHWGQKLFAKYQNDSEWSNLSVPIFPDGYKNVQGKSASLRQIWSIQGGGKHYPERLWLGTEPGALFLSENKGKDFKIVQSLWEHPTRLKNKQWFGAGKDLPFVHSIIVDPKNNDITYLSVSCAGTFKSNDGGRTWACVNKGMKASYLPNTTPEAGYDPHHMIMSTANNQVLWQQNHCGIYRTINGGQEWQDVSGKSGFPNYGFAIAIEKRSIMEAWVIPVEDETSRVPPALKLQVLKTNDGGQSWLDSSEGLPQDPFFGIVLRDGFAKKAENLAFGTTNGNVYFSSNRGARWNEVSTNLTKVNCIEFSTS